MVEGNVALGVGGGAFFAKAGGGDDLGGGVGFFPGVEVEMVLDIWDLLAL